MKTENSVYKPHDKLFKGFMNTSELVVAFLRARLPQRLLEQINLEDCVLVDPNFVSELLQLKQSDIVCRAATKDGRRLDIIIEQQTRQDKWMALRSVEYRLALMRRGLERKGAELPMVLVVCVYTGRKRYTSAQRLFDLYPDPGLAREIMGEGYVLVDLQEAKEEDLRKDGELTVLELALKCGSSGRWREWLWERKEWFMKLLNASSKSKIVEEYIFATEKKMTYQEVQDFLVSINPEKKEEIMTAAAQLINQSRREGEILGIQRGRLEGRQEGEALGIQRGRQEGEALGIQRGRQEGIRQAVLGMRKVGADLEFIRKSTGLSEEEIKKMLQ